MNDEEQLEEIELKLIRAESMMDCAMRELNEAKEMLRIRKENVTQNVTPKVPIDKELQK